MRPHALIVDDEVILLDLLENILEEIGYTVTRAADGDQAIKELDAANFDLVITDFQMGETNGFDVIQKVKETGKNTFTIMITGCYDETCKSLAFSFGADDFILKPFSISDLLDRIELQTSKMMDQPAPGFGSIQDQEQVSGIFPKCKGMTCQEQHH